MLDQEQDAMTAALLVLDFQNSFSRRTGSRSRRSSIPCSWI